MSDLPKKVCKVCSWLAAAGRPVGTLSSGCGRADCNRRARCGPLRRSPDAGELWGRRAGLHSGPFPWGSICQMQGGVTWALGTFCKFTTQGCRGDSEGDSESAGRR